MKKNLITIAALVSLLALGDRLQKWAQHKQRIQNMREYVKFNQAIL